MNQNHQHQMLQRGGKKWSPQRQGVLVAHRETCSSDAQRDLKRRPSIYFRFTTRKSYLLSQQASFKPVIMVIHGLQQLLGQSGALRSQLVFSPSSTSPVSSAVLWAATFYKDVPPPTTSEHRSVAKSTQVPTHPANSRSLVPLWRQHQVNSTLLWGLKSFIES